ncbi:MAG TPA: nuclear transport factor 2 family protein [Rhizomicrobium sp.]|jgi:hypothetical protein|nr:nuclear transport factor 2 family protein [Rhizomicrobium sp.]
MKLTLLAATLTVATTSAHAAVVMCTMIAYPKTQDAVLQAEQNWASALEDRSASALECLLAPNFKETTWKGTTVTRADMITGVAERADSKIALSDLSAELYGDTAIVRGINTVKTAKGDVRVRFTDVFVYLSGKWKPVSAQETLIRP